MHAAAGSVERGDVDGVLAMFDDSANVIISDDAGPRRINVADLPDNFIIQPKNDWQPVV
jgi:ribosomal protein L14